MELKNFLEKKSIVFLLKFFIIFFFLQWLIFFLDISFIQKWVALIEGKFLGLPVQGILVFVGQQPFEISVNCTGLISAGILASIIFSLKKPGIKLKLATFFLGGIALFFANLVRVYFVLVFAQIFSVQAAELVHIISWFAMSVLILLLWYYSSKVFTGIKSFEGFL